MTEMMPTLEQLKRKMDDALATAAKAEARYRKALIDAQPPPTLDEQIASISRELAVRERIYPEWLDTGQITPKKANHQIACMKAILQTLMAQKAASAPEVR